MYKDPAYNNYIGMFQVDNHLVVDLNEVRVSDDSC